MWTHHNYHITPNSTSHKNHYTTPNSPPYHPPNSPLPPWHQTPPHLPTTHHNYLTHPLHTTTTKPPNSPPPTTQHHLNYHIQFTTTSPTQYTAQLPHNTKFTTTSPPQSTTTPKFPTPHPLKPASAMQT